MGLELVEVHFLDTFPQVVTTTSVLSELVQLVVHVSDQCNASSSSSTAGRFFGIQHFAAGDFILYVQLKKERDRQSVTHPRLPV